MILDEVVKVSSEDGYRLKTMLREIVLSEPFLSKTNPNNQLPKSE
jgi:hypothetical protein